MAFWILNNLKIVVDILKTGGIIRERQIRKGLKEYGIHYFAFDFFAVFI